MKPIYIVVVLILWACQYLTDKQTLAALLIVILCVH